MILGVLLGFAAIAAFLSLVGKGGADVCDPVNGEDDLRDTDSHPHDLRQRDAGFELIFGPEREVPLNENRIRKQPPIATSLDKT